MSAGINTTTAIPLTERRGPSHPFGAFPVCTAGFQQMSTDRPRVTCQKLLYKEQTTTSTPYQVRGPAPFRVGRVEAPSFPINAQRERSRSAGVCAACAQRAARKISPFPVPPLSKTQPPLWRGWEGQGEGQHEMAHEDKQGMHPTNGGIGRAGSRKSMVFTENGPPTDGG